MKISVIVPVRDDAALDGLLESLARQRAARPFEVVVALDGSKRQPRLPSSLPIRLLSLPPRGPYAARNAAARQASGEILAFTDSDCLCPPDWLARAAGLFEEPSLLALQGGSVVSRGSRLAGWIQDEYERYVASHAATGYRFFCNTRNFAIRRDLLLSLPFPERFPRGGDGMYGRQLARAGVTIRYEPEWTVEHRHATRRLAEAHRAFEEGREGAHWLRATGVDLFGEKSSGTLANPGAWLHRVAPGSPPARRATAALLAAVSAAFGAASLLLPGRAGEPPFRLFRRGMHLSGKLFGESDRMEEHA